MAYSKPPVGALLDRTHPLSRGLIGYWLLGEGGGTRVNDSFGNNPGVLTNFSGNPWGGSPSGGRCPKLDGVDDYIDLGISNLLAPAALSFVIWGTFSSFTNGYSAVFSRIKSGTFYQFFVKSDGKIAIYVRGSGGGSSYDGTGAFTLSTGVEYCLAGTYDGTTIRGYVDAVLDNSQAYADDLSSITDINTTVGTQLSTPSRCCDFKANNLRLYNRGLSREELIWLRAERYAGFASDGLDFGDFSGTAPPPSTGRVFGYVFG